MRNLLTVLITGFVLLLVTNCVSNPTIPTRISGQLYMITKQDTAGIFGNPAAFKASIIEEANTFAESKDKEVLPVSIKIIPAGAMRFSQVEYQFLLVDHGDERLKHIPSLAQIEDPSFNGIGFYDAYR
jgi:hypothetical protein